MNEISDGFSSRMKQTLADKQVIERMITANGQELLSFIERLEADEASKREAAENQKETMAEAKARGYDTKAIRAIIKRRKMRPDDLAEFEAVVELYIAAIGGA